MIIGFRWVCVCVFCCGVRWHLCLKTLGTYFLMVLVVVVVTAHLPCIVFQKKHKNKKNNVTVSQVENNTSGTRNDTHTCIYYIL
jgi:hypothetical protein